MPAVCRPSVRLAKTFRWLTMTPFGVAVEPEVYWMKAIERSSSRGGVKSLAAPSGMSSVLSQRIVASAGASAHSTFLCGRSARGVSAAAASASPAIAWKRGRVRWSREGSGGWIGTGTSPPNRHP